MSEETPVKKKRHRRTKAEMEAARGIKRGSTSVVTLKNGHVLTFGCVGRAQGGGFEFFYSMDGGTMRTIKVALSEIAAVESDGMEQPAMLNQSPTPVLQPQAALTPFIVEKTGPRVHAPLKGIINPDMVPVQGDNMIRGETVSAGEGVPVKVSKLRLATGEEATVVGSMS